ncbi:MAG TPA: thrombospondin type 3 repeat-containing protein, partial [Polyangiaceae bacterium]
DNDKDGVPDAQDKCPLEAGPAGTGTPGCPIQDTDADGVLDPTDRCPADPEDKDAFEDEDGCPDPDNDQDGVPDDEDACVTQAGSARSDPLLHGCPSPDRDGDTFDDPRDRCPEQPENFDGKEDDDGCPEPGGGAALARWEVQANRQRLVLAKAIAFEKNGGLAPASETTLRAIGALLNQNPELVLLVATRPTGAGSEAEQLALNRSFELVEALRRFTHRDEAAETIGWAAVRKLPHPPGATTGFIVLSPREKP